MPNGFRWVAGFLLQVDGAKIVVYEGDESDPVVDLLEADELAGEDDGDIGFLAVHAGSAAGGDHVLPIVQGGTPLI